jgi:hypothetical protein
VSDIGGIELSAPSEEMAWPPAPHDPRERALICTLVVRAPALPAHSSRHGSTGRRGAPASTRWEVRAFPIGGRMHRYFAPRGLLHLQLWQPESGVSMLTPSRLTLGRWEVFPVEGWKRGLDQVADLRRLVRSSLRVEPPTAAQLAAARAWFVDREERRALASRSGA